MAERRDSEELPIVMAATAPVIAARWTTPLVVGRGLVPRRSVSPHVAGAVVTPPAMHRPGQSTPRRRSAAAGAGPLGPSGEGSARRYIRAPYRFSAAAPLV